MTTELPDTRGIYSIKDLKAAWREGKRFTFVHFWKPDYTNDVENLSAGCFSQWQPSPFEIDGINYSCAEQYMMSCKARLFPDNDDILHKIKTTNRPNVMMSLGRKVRNYDVNIWNQNCRKIVFNGNLAKFSQNENMKRKLMSYDSNSIFVEASPSDRKWGIQLPAGANGANDPFRWRGTNYLGFELTRLRDYFLYHELQQLE